MTIAPRERFDTYATRKTREAVAAPIASLTTLIDRRSGYPLHGIGNGWSRVHYGGNFDLFVPEDDGLAVSLVFVQSKNGNTRAANPSTLGGGSTDLHLIYEGLSRVAADAVLAGAGSVHGDAFFSVWHPELIALRETLGLVRHPAQIVISERGRLDRGALLFDVPDVPVVLIAGPEAVSHHADWLRTRPWIQTIALEGEGLRTVMDRVRQVMGLHRVSAIGGPVTASRLVDAGLVQDLYLTTSSKIAGEPNTPWYVGSVPQLVDLITKKQWLDGLPVVFEHLAIAGRRPIE